MIAGRRDGVVDAGLDGPAALAGVLGVAADLGQAGVVVERGDQQVEQPRPDDRALAPGAEDLGDVVDEVDLLEQLPALGVALHDGVLDAVVDHLGEVPGADLAGVHGAELALGLERVEGRLHLRDVVGRSRRTSGRSRSPGPRHRRRRRSRRSRCPSRPASRRCAWSSVQRELPPSTTRSPSPSRSPSSLMRRAGRVAGGHHHPDDLGRGQLPRRARPGSSTSEMSGLRS